METWTKNCPLKTLQNIHLYQLYIMLDETLAFFTQLSFYKHGLKMVIASAIFCREVEAEFPGVTYLKTMWNFLE